MRGRRRQRRILYITQCGQVTGSRNYILMGSIRNLKKNFARLFFGTYWSFVFHSPLLSCVCIRKKYKDDMVRARRISQPIVAEIASRAED